MGLSISWIAVQGRSKDEVLAELELADTGVADERLEARVSLGCADDGWVAVVSNDLEFVTPAKLRRLSLGGMAIGCMEEEHVMFSGARCFVDGRETWAVIHESEKGVHHLHVEGQPPPQFSRIRATALRKQQADDPKGKEVDYIYDVPPKTAASVCKVGPHRLGRRALRYTALKAVDEDRSLAAPRSAWWRRLLARTTGRA